MWTKIKDFWHRSETLFWADVQSALGFLALVVTYVDPSVLAPYLSGESWFVWFVLLNGIATRYLRKRGADDLK